MKKYYWKVLHKRDGKLASFIDSVMSDPTEQVALEYNVGQWTRPKIEGSKLFVFATRKDAREFVAGNVSDLTIRKCEVEGVSDQEPICNPVILGCKSIVNFWRQEMCWRHEFNSVPYGSVWAEAVKIVK